MKIHEYSQMMKHMTKKDNKSPEERNRIIKKQRLENQQRMLKKRKEYGINTDALEKQIVTLQKELSEDTITTKQREMTELELEQFKAPVKRNPLDSLEEKIIDGMVVGGELDPEEQIVKYDSATGLFMNKKKDIGFKDVGSARKHNEVYEKYVPEIQNLKKSVTPRVKPKVTPRVRPFVKPQVKPTIKAPIPEFDMNFEPYKRNDSEEFRIAEANFNKLLEESKKQKELEANQGLPGIIPGAVRQLKEIERSERRTEQNKPKTYGGDDDL
jgi:hypothetical protein